MSECPDKIEPWLSEQDMLLFIKLTLQDVICGALCMEDPLIDVDTVQKALQHTHALQMINQLEGNKYDIRQGE